MEYLSSITDHQWLVTFALKSPNVLITRDKLEVKLCDVGQGNLRDLARTMTSVGTVAWTGTNYNITIILYIKKDH